MGLSGKELRLVRVIGAIVPYFESFLTRCGCPASKPILSVLGTAYSLGSEALLY